MVSPKHYFLGSQASSRWAMPCHLLLCKWTKADLPCWRGDKSKNRWIKTLLSHGRAEVLCWDPGLWGTVIGPWSGGLFFSLPWEEDPPTNTSHTVCGTVALLGVMFAGVIPILQVFHFDFCWNVRVSWSTKPCLQNAENIIKKGLFVRFREHLNAAGFSVFHFKFNSAERVRWRMRSFLFLDGGEPVNGLHKLIFCAALSLIKQK